jgi:hypothetical protein
MLLKKHGEKLGKEKKSVTLGFINGLGGKRALPKNVNFVGQLKQRSLNGQILIIGIDVILRITSGCVPHVTVFMI